MLTKPMLAHIVELDGKFFHVDGEKLSPIGDPREVSGDKWLVTDFQEGMSRLMTVEGPVKYAELLVRRKLQEDGEFEEPVNIFIHWQKKRGKNTADVFFTAVPARLSAFYLDELGRQEDITLVFAMYGALWQMVSRTGSKAPVAVVLRHHRFAEVLVASKDHVYFANRCVAFDTEQEQVDALWASVLTDIEAVEKEHHISVGKIICHNWLSDDAPTHWPQQWQRRIVIAEQVTLQMDDHRHAISWPHVLNKQSVISSISAFKEKLFYYTKCWVPALNFFLVLLAGTLLIGMLSYRGNAYRLQQRMDQVQQQIGKMHVNSSSQQLSDDFEGILKFVGELDRIRSTPSYQQIVDDLTQAPFNVLALHHLKVDYASDQVRLELSGEIEAPFDSAHGGYQGFVGRLTALGYRIEESRFETQISKSQVVLKLSRPVI